MQAIPCDPEPLPGRAEIERPPTWSKRAGFEDSRMRALRWSARPTRSLAGLPRLAGSNYESLCYALADAASVAVPGPWSGAPLASFRLGDPAAASRQPPSQRYKGRSRAQGQAFRLEGLARLRAEWSNALCGGDDFPAPFRPTMPNRAMEMELNRDVVEHELGPVIFGDASGGNTGHMNPS